MTSLPRDTSIGNTDFLNKLDRSQLVELAARLALDRDRLTGALERCEDEVDVLRHALGVSEVPF